MEDSGIYRHPTLFGTLHLFREFELGHLCAALSLDLCSLLPGLATSQVCAWFGRMYFSFNVAVVHRFFL